MLPKTIVKLIRQRKEEGFSLTEIAKEFGCCKSTASLYCRDLFYHPLRKYKTEKEARQIPISNRKGKPRKKYPRDHQREHLRRLLPCIKCGKLRQADSKGGLCIICHKQDRKDNAQYHQRQPTFCRNAQRQKSVACKLIVKECRESPIGKHSCISGECTWCSQFVRG